MDKQKMIAACVIGSLLAMGASASEDSTSYYHYAPVTEVEPIISTKKVVTANVSCRTERPRRDRVYHEPYRESSFVPALIGGLLGGIVGKQFGDGRGRTAFTVAGALAGARIASHVHRAGNRAQRRADRHISRYEQRTDCNEYAEAEILDGYRVTYLYQGQEYSLFMDERPGAKIPIAVNVTPLVSDDPGLLVNTNSGYWNSSDRTVSPTPVWGYK